MLRINVCRKADAGKEEARPVILSIHPYGKDNVAKRRGKKWTFSAQYRALRQPQPVTCSALTGWEAPDPAWWTAQGFTVVNADSRGCGHSDGSGSLLSAREAEDTYDLVQWIAGQPTGFTAFWSRNVRRDTRQAYDLQRMQDEHPLRDHFWRSLVPDLPAITVPMLVCGSFSDNNLHSRGSIRAFTHGGSAHARLYTHRGGKWATFYSETALAEQLTFFRDVLDGAPASRSARLEVREDRDTVAAVREETDWPLARTRWRPLYLAGPGTLDTQEPSTAGRVAFETHWRAVAFSWTMPADTELTGPMTARLWVELDGCDDANLFVGVAPANSCAWWSAGAGCARAIRSPASSRRPTPSPRAVA